MTALLEVTALSKEFGGLRAVDELGLTVERGAIVGLIGPNGAGKTTTFNLVTGQLRPTAGDVYFNGRRVTGMPPYDLVRLGLVRTFQSTVLYGEASVLENVMRGCAARAEVGLLSGLLRPRIVAGMERRFRERAEGLLEFMELGVVRDELAGNLPYGYQRALGVAIGLATGPELLMLDEPVAGMNPEETTHMAGLIRRVNQSGTSIVVVEHDMSFVMQLCQRIVVMNYGKKIAEGAPETIRNDPAVIAAYLGMDDDASA
jgi:branched-chain amino acid transport system ATP-binding protein